MVEDREPLHAVCGVRPFDVSGWRADILCGAAVAGEVYRFADGNVELTFLSLPAEQRFSAEAAAVVGHPQPCRDCPDCESQREPCALIADLDALFAIHLRDAHDRHLAETELLFSS